LALRQEGLVMGGLVEGTSQMDDLRRELMRVPNEAAAPG
jgi:hypothetical protein